MGIRERVRSGLLAAAMLAGCAGSAAAQAAGAGGVEVLGVRAQGMAGAFVAVADDATAAYWNPAGLGTGDFFSLAAGAVARLAAVGRRRRRRRYGPAPS